MKFEKNNAWLHRYTCLTAVATLFLICIGGIVTSKEAGLAVPDWPTTYGYNMFLFPISKMVGNIFHEHLHRLVASGVGLMTMILAAWLWAKEKRCWMKWLGVVALATVILQGILGGLRVVWLKDQIGIFHACLAQLFFVLISLMALFTSNWWIASRKEHALIKRHDSLLILVVTLLIFVQLMIGATMRHEHIGLSIPDFPLAYGQVWPKLSEDTLIKINEIRAQEGVLATTRFQIYLQLIHRVMAFLIFCGIVGSALLVSKLDKKQSVLKKMTRIWVGLIVLQVFLGAWTIWSNKAADIATMHVAVGSMSLMMGAVVVAMLKRLAYDMGWQNNLKISGVS